MAAKCEICEVEPANGEREDACDICDRCYARLNRLPDTMMQEVYGLDALRQADISPRQEMYGFLSIFFPKMPDSRRRKIAMEQPTSRWELKGHG